MSGDIDIATQCRPFVGQILAVAAALAREHFGRTGGAVKQDDHTQILTAADLAVGRYLVHAIRTAYPSHNVVDEEAGVIDQGSRWTWVIDPIDGTSNFAVGVPLYCMLLGLLRDGVPVMGAMALPATGDLYTAVHGAGVEKNGTALPRVSDAIPLERRLICYGLDGDRRAPGATRAEGALLADLALACVNIRTSGSMWDLAMLLEGRFGATLGRVAKVWDLVGSHVLAEEAGCQITSLDGAPLDYRQACATSNQRYSWCIAPPRLHAELQAIIQQHPLVAC